MSIGLGIKKRRNTALTVSAYPRTRACWKQDMTSKFVSNLAA
jgi:hypothetical protein